MLENRNRTTAAYSVNVLSFTSIIIWWWLEAMTVKTIWSHLIPRGLCHTTVMHEHSYLAFIITYFSSSRPAVVLKDSDLPSAWYITTITSETAYPTDQQTTVPIKQNYLSKPSKSPSFSLMGLQPAWGSLDIQWTIGCWSHVAAILKIWTKVV